MNKRYIVDLMANERTDLLALLGKGVAPARKLTRARILLLADKGKTDQEIADALHVHRVTVERTRRRFVEGGAERALNEQRRPGGRPKLDGKQEAMLVALAGWRHVEVTVQRTAGDFARQMKALVEVHYPEAEVIAVVLDNLSTHSPAALYRTFRPEEALRLLKRLEFHYTPKHGSWLNMAELEFSVLGRQCLDRRLPDHDSLAREVAAWQRRRNRECATAQWRFTLADARTRMRRLYPA
jgi:transposase